MRNSPSEYVHSGERQELFGVLEQRMTLIKAGLQRVNDTEKHHHSAWLYLSMLASGVAEERAWVNVGSLLQGPIVIAAQPI